MGVWSPRKRVAPFLASALVIVALVAASTNAVASPLPVVGGPLLDEIAAMPAGQWRNVNRNLFSDVWTPASLRPLKGLSNPAPDNIISAWSGFAWDTRRGDVILYGGGHANYSGNDVYRWRSSSMRWERASLPSEIAVVPGTEVVTAIDGADAAPASAHTYDNNLYLPVFDRFLTLGGAAIGTGGNFERPDEANPGQVRRTGPYLFDPERADGWKVGGTTGSHVQRVAPYPDIEGGNMWANRDHTRTIPASTQPSKHVSGCTAYAEENGIDVVYVGATGGSGSNPSLYRYTFGSVANPSLDTISKVGRFWNGTGGQTTCGYDPQRKLFVRTGNNFRPFVYWDLTSPGPQNDDARLEVNASISAFLDWIEVNAKQVDDCGLDFDPLDDAFAVWCGGPQVWKLRPPAIIGVSGWTIDAQPIGGTGPGLGTGTGVLGKWKYIPGYDVFVALHNATSGNIWVYKPLDWTAPRLGDAVNWVPQVALDQPSGGSVYTLGDTIAMSATASDIDGSVARVDYLVDGISVGTRTASPYNLSWTPSVGGSYALQVRAVDNRGAESLSASASIQVVVTNTSPTASLTNPAQGSDHVLGTAINLTATANDTDGSVVLVEFFANASKIGEDSSAPYALSWTPPAVGSYSLTVRATDNGNASATSAAVGITVSDAPGPGDAVVLQQGVNGYAGSTDTMLSSYHPNSNFGSRTTLQNFAQNYANLFRFAIFASEGGPVPDGAVIESATLYIYKQAYSSTYRLHALLKSWDEGQATWMQAKTGSPWSVAGAKGIDSDYEAQHDAEYSAPYASGWMSFDVRDRLRAYAGGTANHGWRIVPVSSGSTTRNFLSSEYADPALRPRLVLTHSGGGTANVAPTADLTSPDDGSTVTVGTTVTVAANASDVDGTVAKVEFYANAVKIGEDVTAPYSLAWTPSIAGSYSLVARAVDNRGLPGSSASRSLNVAPANVAPTASLTNPAQGSDHVLGTAINLTATANDTDGSVVLVEFFANASKIGEDSSAPYALSWTPPAVGSYSLTVRATDNGNASASSAAVGITVSDAPGPGDAVVLQQGVNGYAGSTDTMLSSYHPNSNFGSRTTLQNFAQNYANLFRFAIFASEGGPVPDGAVIESATLYIYKQAYSSTYRLHALLKPWDEGQATWMQAKTGTPWAVAGAKGIDSDYEAQHDAEYSAPYESGWMSFDVRDRLRAYASGTANHGWRIVPITSGSTTRNFLSSEYATTTLRPRLSITLSAP